MRTVSVSRPMSAPRSAVWSVLADFPNISTWNGGIKASHATSEATSGVGAKRHCELAPIGTLEETVAEWVDGERMVVNIDSTTKLPIERGVATFTIGESTTSIDYEYESRGLVGRLAAPLLARQLTKGFSGFLDELDAAAVAAASPS